MFSDTFSVNENFLLFFGDTVFHSKCFSFSFFTTIFGSDVEKCNGRISNWELRSIVMLSYKAYKYVTKSSRQSNDTNIDFPSGADNPS